MRARVLFLKSEHDFVINLYKRDLQHRRYTLCAEKEIVKLNLGYKVKRRKSTVRLVWAMDWLKSPLLLAVLPRRDDNASERRVAANQCRIGSKTQRQKLASRFLSYKCASYEPG